MVTYELVHVHPDKTEELLHSARHLEDFALITEQPKYLGTWINPQIKVLRWNRGELQVRTIEHKTRISTYTVSYLGSMPLYNLTVVYHDTLKCICLNNNTIVGQDINRRSLWQTNSWTRLSEIIGKDLAYEVQVYYEKYLIEFKVKGAM